MRQIKFRCWTGKIFHTFSIPKDVGDDSWATIWGEWQQFTGLTDKKGGEIYEGDILGNFTYDLIAGAIGGNVYVVEDLRKLYSVDSDAEYSSEGITKKSEILGNIYENSELLK